ncbi:diguanylate cyclase [Afipia sp. P52-10]|uniref:putative bifunctional diguanylate cyclase/phosphodiesterase n=1 Tax=Afipia sp. P52-10 TaxID=1429916 RepID=UPI0003DF111C|nr:diguanylate cyclase [Afipia sp. P52-10]
MMRVITCVFVEHDIKLVLLAAMVCLAGSWTTIRLFTRANTTAGLASVGWHFLAAVAAGSSIWCTHFIAIIAYDPGTPVSFNPVLTIVSLLIAMAGTAVGLTIASTGPTQIAPAAGGLIVGLAIALMHYTGMAAYHVEGLVEWTTAYLVASVVLSALFGAAALHVAIRHTNANSKYIATGILVLAIVSLHFTGMAAVQVTPMNLGGAHADPDALQAMALAVAVVGLVVVGAGIASYLIDDRTRLDNYQRLREMAMNDALTGLPNRTCFTDHLDLEIQYARRAASKIALICIDLDRFKEINDLRGHSVGDEVLKTLAGRMSDLLGEGEFVARLGGDEFVAVKRMRDQADLLDFISRLETALFAPIWLDNFDATAGASLGVAIYPDDADNRDMLTNNADLAMYRAKADVTKIVCFYERSMDEAVRSRRTLASELRSAMENGELDLHYQVQTSVSTGEVLGYEALLRWKHPTRGFIPPSLFIPLAEENGLIKPIGDWVLRTACAKAAAWPNDYKIAVNLSPVQFTNADLPKLVHEVLLETGLPPSRLELEITETTIFADRERALHMLRRIKALGVTIAIDDFGTGYSSLETLRAFPFDKIKLDRSFILEVETSPQSKAIIRAVLALGQSLDIPVLAEGVETSSQLTLLADEGCDEAQGFLLGRPMPLEEITKSLSEVRLVPRRKTLLLPEDAEFAQVG